jgi:hypothetical protein
MASYSFFNRFNLVINTHGHRGYERYFDNEYLRIAEQELTEGAPTVTVEIVGKLPEIREGDLVDQVRYKRMFTFEYLVRDLEGENTTIYFKSHPVDKVYMNAIGVFVQAQVLEPVMYFKLLEQNILFMHAAGVMKGDAGYLFPAHGGTGKTTTSMALLAHGFRLLGDDLLFVDLDSRVVHPYPRPLHLFTYNVQNLHGAKVPFKYQAAIYGKNMLRFFLERILRTEFLISTRVHADELFSQGPFGDAAPYRKLCFLVKEGPVTREVELTEATIPDVAGEIMESADLNESLYGILEDREQIERVKKLELKVIGDLLGHFGSFVYVNTRKLDLDDLTPFVQEHLESQPA